MYKIQKLKKDQTLNIVSLSDASYNQTAVQRDRLYMVADSV